VRALLRELKTTGLGEHQQLLSAVVKYYFQISNCLKLLLILFSLFHTCTFCYNFEVLKGKLPNYEEKKLRTCVDRRCEVCLKYLMISDNNFRRTEYEAG